MYDTIWCKQDPNELLKQKSQYSRDKYLYWVPALFPRNFQFILLIKYLSQAFLSKKKHRLDPFEWTLCSNIILRSKAFTYVSPAITSVRPAPFLDTVVILILVHSDSLINDGFVVTKSGFRVNVF